MPSWQSKNIVHIYIIKPAYTQITYKVQWNILSLTDGKTQQTHCNYGVRTQIEPIERSRNVGG